MQRIGENEGMGRRLMPSGPGLMANRKRRVLATARSAYVHRFRNVGLYGARLAVLALTAVIAAAWVEKVLVLAFFFVLDIIMILSLAAASSVAFKHLSSEAADPGA